MENGNANNAAAKCLANYMKSPILSVEAELTVREVIERINKHRVGSFLVTESGKYTGIVTKRDLIRKVAGGRKDPATTPVSAVMTRKILTLDHAATLKEAGNFMAEHGIQRIVVTRNGEIVGMFSSKDMARAR